MHTWLVGNIITEEIRTNELLDDANIVTARWMPGRTGSGSQSIQLQISLQDFLPAAKPTGLWEPRVVVLVVVVLLLLDTFENQLLQLQNKVIDATDSNFDIGFFIF